MSRNAPCSRCKFPKKLLTRSFPEMVEITETQTNKKNNLKIFDFVRLSESRFEKNKKIKNGNVISTSVSK